MQATLLIAVMALGAPALKDPPKKALLVGEWVAESVVIGGEVTVQNTERSPLIYVFKPNGEWIIRRGEKALKDSPSWFAVDVTKNPWEIDLTNDKVNPEILRMKGIYKVEGEKLTLCYAAPKVDRPAKYESPGKSQIVLWVFKRKS